MSSFQSLIFQSLFSLLRQVLEDMEMLSAFTAVLHVPNISKPEQIINVLEEYDLFNKQELSTLAKRLAGLKYGIQNITSIFDFNLLNFVFEFFLIFAEFSSELRNFLI